jgi:hypothetical protein
MSSPSVRIRMYRQGLGDCFLLSFPRSNTGTSPDFHMLIDCGVIIGTDPATLINAVQDIYTTTNGHIDLLVGTHEHWDHLSGFNQARDVFDKFIVDNVWLAWTEDPDNATARSLRGNRSAKVTALRSAVAQMTAPGMAADKESIQRILGFFGDDPALGVAAAPGAGNQAAAPAAHAGGSTQAAMLYLASRHDAKVHFCYPTKDEPHPLDGVNNVRVYIFGPPEDMKMMKLIDPTSQGKETYGVASSGAEDAFFAAVNASGQGSADDQIQELSIPFDSFYRISPAEAQAPQQDGFFRQHYGFNKNGTEAWRRIDDDWLNVANELALNLDSDTNNTSLVLAIELGDPGCGKVLLFAADAQVGNWLSWGNLSWSITSPGNPGLKVSAPDLLARTVLYKVGHHGSHNATMRAQGLELMLRDDLVAMIPVDHAMAVKKQWNMPFPDLFTRLQQKTRGRVIRIDSGLPTRQDASTLTDAEWQAFTQSATQTDLYIEFSVSIDS